MDNENFVTFSASDRSEGDMDKDLAPLAALRRIRLTAAERDRMLMAILEAPAPAFSFFRSLQRVAAVSLAIVFLAGSSVSYAAEGALPGDALYGFKVHVNERVRGSLHRSSSARARWEARLAARRLEEGETLAVRGRMNAGMREQVREHFRRHAQQVAMHLDTMLGAGEPDAAAEVSAEFEAGLRAHEAVLARMERVEERVAADLSLLLEVRDFLRAAKETRTIAQARTRLIADSGLAAATRTTIAAANREIKAARGVLKKHGAKNPRLAEEAAVKLTAAEEDLREAESTMTEETESSALDTVSTALSTAQEVSLILKHAEDGTIGVTMMAPDQPPAVLESGMRQRAQARIDVAGKRITDTRKLLDKYKNRLTEEEIKKTQETLKLAATALTDAQARLEAGAEADALTHADAAIEHAKKARKTILRERDAEQSASAGASVSAAFDAVSSVGVDGSSLEIDASIKTDGGVRLHGR